MKTVTEHIRQHLLSSLGFHSRKPALSLRALRASQWCNEYEFYRRNRMVMGYFRYGDIHRQSLNDYDLPEEAIVRIRRYQRDGNLEHLVDAGNMIMLAYMQGIKSGKIMNAIDDGEHARPRI